MRWSLRAMLAVTVMTAFAAAVIVRPAAAVDVRVTLYERNVALRSLCERLNALAGLRIDVDPAVQANLYVHVIDMPARAVLDAAVATAGWCVVEGRGRNLHVRAAATEPLRTGAKLGARLPREAHGRYRIEVKDAALSDAVDEFRRRAPDVTFLLDDKGWPHDFRIPHLRIAAASLRSALDQFASQADARVHEDEAGRFQIHRPPRIHLGPVEWDRRQYIDLMARMNGINIVMAEAVSGSVHLHGRLTEPWEKTISYVVASGSCVIAVKNNILCIAPGLSDPEAEVREMLTELLKGPQANDDTAARLVQLLECGSPVEQESAETDLIWIGDAAAHVIGPAWERAQDDVKRRLSRVIERIWRAGT